jgi:hypothetical protein
MPVPHAEVYVAPLGAGQPSQANYFETDINGHLRANPAPGQRYNIVAFAPDHTPYLRTSITLEWPKGSIEQSVDIALTRGVLLRGKLTEAGSGKPVAGAKVNYLGLRASARGAEFGPETAADGSFAIAVEPGRGHLFVLAASDDYRLQEFGLRLVREGLPGGARYYAHAVVPCEPKLGTENPEIAISLQPGITIKGRVLDPDGNPVPDALILFPLAMKDLLSSFRHWRGDLITHVRDGQFQLHGLGPETELTASFLEPTRKLGATVKVSGKLANSQPITVRLEPCGTARARLVNPAGKPVSHFLSEYMASIELIPGPPRSNRSKADESKLNSVGDFLIRIDRLNYERDPTSDAEGRIIFPALIPGATYRIQDRTGRITDSGIPSRKQFTVKPGETLDLGDILIGKPQQ